MHLVLELLPVILAMLALLLGKAQGFSPTAIRIGRRHISGLLSDAGGWGDGLDFQDGGRSRGANDRGRRQCTPSSPQARRRKSDRPVDERGQWKSDKRGERRERYSGGGGRDGRYGDRNAWQDGKPSEPAYGRYDGDHLFGISPTLAALTTNRRKFKELLVQEGLEARNKKVG